MENNLSIVSQLHNLQFQNIKSQRILIFKYGMRETTGNDNDKHALQCNGVSVQTILFSSVGPRIRSYSWDTDNI